MKLKTLLKNYISYDSNIIEIRYNEPLTQKTHAEQITTTEALKQYGDDEILNYFVNNNKFTIWIY